MTVPTNTLADVLAEIRDAVLERLRREVAAEGRLEGLKGVLWGNLTRSPAFPGLWIVTPGATQVEPWVHHETWDLPLVLVVAAKDAASPDPAQDAIRWAANARAILTAANPDGRGRTLGLPYVEDVTSAQFDPFSDRFPGKEERGLHIANAVVTVRFTILEPDAL